MSSPAKILNYKCSPDDIVSSTDGIRDVDILLDPEFT